MRDKLICGIPIGNKISMHTQEKIWTLIDRTPVWNIISLLRDYIVQDLYRKINEKP